MVSWYDKESMVARKPSLDDALRAEKSSAYNMLPKKNRLNTSFFELVSKNGKRVDSFYFSGICLKTVEKQGFSVVVSKKLSKTAPKRNAFRRRVYTALAQYKNLPHSYILFPKKTAMSADFGAIIEDLRLLLAKCDTIAK